MTKITAKENIKNLKRCPSFDTCSRNLCPLDSWIEERSGGDSDKCRYFREGKKRAFNKEGKLLSKAEIKKTKKVIWKKIGGTAIPKKLIKFIPKKNIKRLNEASKKIAKVSS